LEAAPWGEGRCGRRGGALPTLGASLLSRERPSPSLPRRPSWEASLPDMPVISGFLSRRGPGSTSVHEVHIPVTASHRAASMIGAGAAAGQRRLSPRRQATLPTPQKNGSGPFTTPLTFLRQA